MEINWLNRHINTDSVELYVSPISGRVTIGVPVAEGFVPILVFEDKMSFFEFIKLIIEIVERHTSQMRDIVEVPEVFKKAFDTNDTANGAIQ